MRNWVLYSFCQLHSHGKRIVGVNTFDKSMRHEAEIALAVGNLPVGREIARNGKIIACG